jgi:hypothetical protein
VRGVYLDFLQHDVLNRTTSLARLAASPAD